MKLITRDTDYTVQALRFIARQKKDLVSAAEMVKKLGVPRPFLRKILQTLDKKGLLKSCKGKGGGFRLNRRPEKIFLIDLIKIFQGPLKITEHLLKSKICPNIHNCKLKKRMDKIEKYVMSELKDINLASLL